jgi:glycerol-3-phosphate dehydrogenase
VINATGVFADAVRRLDEPDAHTVVTASQGAHVVLDRQFLPGTSALMVPKTADGRVLFAIPWHGHVVVGTTDTPISKSVLEPRPLGEEIEFLLDHTARYLTKDPAASDVLSAFAGLRPLVGSEGATETARLSRDHTVLVSASGLVTLTGGKWTTYRRMGQDAVDQAVAVASLEPRLSRTREHRLHGWVDSAAASSNGPAEFGKFPPHWELHGADAPELAALAGENPDWSAPLHPRLPYRAVDVIWAVRQEMARSVEDVLARRTRALMLDARAAIELAPEVAALVATELGRDNAWRDAQVAAFSELARGYLI